MPTIVGSQDLVEIFRVPFFPKNQLLRSSATSAKMLAGPGCWMMCLREQVSRPIFTVVREM